MPSHVALLAPDNFTPPSRTPWGGTAIVGRYKRDLGLDATTRVGESWELSVSPEFPSALVDGTPLTECCARDPAHWLGDEALHGGTSLLVKLLDAADNLSVQIHPDDHYEGLGPEECGKPESWYVLDAEPGAGLYLALAPHTTHDNMREALEKGGDVASLLDFVPVETGDFFVVTAGTAHAIGRGVTLIEPQIVRPGRKGVTYRYWDWNRRYDAKGMLSPEGTPRALHISHALAVTDWSRARGASFLAETRVRAGRCDVRSAVTLTKLCAREGAPLCSMHLDVSRLAGTGTLTDTAHGRLRALTVAEGEVLVCAGDERVVVARGRTAAIAAGAAVHFEAQGAHAVLSSVA